MTVVRDHVTRSLNSCWQFRGFLEQLSSSVTLWFTISLNGVYTVQLINPVGNQLVQGNPNQSGSKMRQKRAKAYKRLMNLYSQNFGFRSPFQVLGQS